MNVRNENIFYQPRTDDGAQYEQNVVKHCFAVLSHTNDEATKRLLREFHLSEGFEDEFEKFGYATEVGAPDDGYDCPTFVVGISNQQETLEQVDPGAQAGRADGQITAYTRNDDPVVRVVFEAKTGVDSLGSSQLHRYKEQFNAQDIEIVEWSTIHGVFQAVRSDVGQPDAFLLDQFADFLRREEMSGVVAEATQPEDADEKTQINQIVVKADPSANERYEIRFLSQYRDSVEEDFALYYSGWLSAAGFAELFGQIPEEVRYATFVGQSDEDGEPEGKSANIQRPAHYKPHEFTSLFSDLDAELRERVFVDLDLEPLWDQYV